MAWVEGQMVCPTHAACCFDTPPPTFPRHTHTPTPGIQGAGLAWRKDGWTHSSGTARCGELGEKEEALK